MASFSSRGPNRAIDTIVPSVTAPGVDILAAFGVGDPDPPIHGFISGTSMSSPHVAGAGALLTQARPDWSPGAAAVGADDHGPADGPQPRRHAGHPVRAGLRTRRRRRRRPGRPALRRDASPTTWRPTRTTAAIPKTLNLPSFADTQCLVDLLVGARGRPCRTTPTPPGAGRRHLDGNRPRPTPASAST